MNISNVFKNFKTQLVRRSPEILTGIGLSSMILAVPFSVIGTVKACKKIEEKKKELNKPKLTKKEVVATTWTCYIPAFISCTGGAVCIVCAGAVNYRRNAALATAYSLSEKALTTYQEKVIETIGEKKEEAIRDAIAKDKLVQNQVTTSEVIVTRKGETLCYDSISKRYFRSDMDTIRKAENKLNRELYSSMFVSLSDFYYEIELPKTEVSDDLGWNVDNGPIEFRYSAQLADDGTPCLVIDYRFEPRYDYRHLL